MILELPNLGYAYSLKTTDAELRGLRELSKGRLLNQRAIPIFELTRSRISKKSEYGEVEKRMAAIAEISSDRPFVLDLTAHEDLSNPQIQRMYDDADGFANWRGFLARYKDLPIIPSIHTYADEGFAVNLRAQVAALADNYNVLAFRVSSAMSAAPFLDVISSVLGGLKRLLLIVDAEYVDEENIAAERQQLTRRLVEIARYPEIGRVVIMSSSFPSSVTSRVGGEDAYGELVMCEKLLYRQVSAASPFAVCYGDYASIHPRRYQTRGGAWVPRVDLPIGDNYIYTRYRRDDGGYVRAANEMVADELYDPIDCWGVGQIESAAAGVLNGKNPAFWISVRMNCHLSRIIDGLS